MNKKGLIIVDVQNDFCVGGALPVPFAEEILPVILKYFKDPNIGYIIATGDLHPLNHDSFGLWPAHCVEGTSGAELHPDLPSSEIDLIFYKGRDLQRDSYSAFIENDRVTSTGLIEKIQSSDRSRDIQDWIILGLATDYCVKETAIDAVKLGLKVTIDLQGSRSINRDPKFLAQLYAFFRENGVVLI
jgi:nicotinamidase/pyrazinamidase